MNKVKSQSFLLGGCVKLKHDSNTAIDIKANTNYWIPPQIDVQFGTWRQRGHAHSHARADKPVDRGAGREATGLYKKVSGEGSSEASMCQGASVPSPPVRGAQSAAPRRPPDHQDPERLRRDEHGAHLQRQRLQTRSRLRHSQHQPPLQQQWRRGVSEWGQLLFQRQVTWWFVIKNHLKQLHCQLKNQSNWWCSCGK